MVSECFEVYCTDFFSFISSLVPHYNFVRSYSLVRALPFAVRRKEAKANPRLHLWKLQIRTFHWFCESSVTCDAERHIWLLHLFRFASRWERVVFSGMMRFEG